MVQNNATTFMYNSWSSGGMKLKLMYCATGHIFQLSTCPYAIAPSHVSLPIAGRAVAELENSSGPRISVASRSGERVESLQRAPAPTKRFF